jgi:hypothetical protein
MLAQTDRMRHYAVPYQDPQATTRLYDDALARGQWGLLWAFLTGRSRALLSLEEVLQSATAQAEISAKTRMVPIAQIDGSENRLADFDRNFNPLHDHTRDRWLSIARAWQRGRYLPPVKLIQVGDHYFVRDGHHRISVARALGWDVVEAIVEVWIVDKSLSKSSLFSLRRFDSPHASFGGLTAPV